MKNRILSLSGIAAAIILTSCGGGGGDNTDSDGIGGPANTAGFAGSTVSFNPTLRFRSGGIVEFVNTETTSIFPKASRTSPAIGTYTYTADAGFITGTMTLDFPTLDGGYSAVVPITDVVSPDGLVRAFTMNFEDEGPFVAQVVSGEIVSAGTKVDSGGGGGDFGNQFTFDEEGNIAAGTTFSKANTSTTYAGFYGGTSLTYSPLEVKAVGETQTFTISGTGNIEFPGVDRRGAFSFTGGEPYTLSTPFVGASNGIITWRGVDARSGGTMIITFDTQSTNVLTIRWDDNTFSDFEQQSYQ